MKNVQNFRYTLNELCILSVNIITDNMSYKCLQIEHKGLAQNFNSPLLVIKSFSNYQSFDLAKPLCCRSVSCDIKAAHSFEV